METAGIPGAMNTVSKTSRSSPISSPSSFPSLPGGPELHQSGSHASSGAAGAFQNNSNGENSHLEPHLLAEAAENANNGATETLESAPTASVLPAASRSENTHPQIPRQLLNGLENHGLLQNSTPSILQNLSMGSRQNLQTDMAPPAAPSGPVRRSSFGLGFLSLFANSIRSQGTAHGSTSEQFMSNSPTIANLSHHLNNDSHSEFEDAVRAPDSHDEASANQLASSTSQSDAANANANANASGGPAGMDKDGCYSIRLTPLIDHSSSTSGLYFAPVIRKIKPDKAISIGRYTDKNRAAAHAPQGSSSPIVFKSKVVSRTHALFQCNEDGQWFIKDCKSSSGTFLNHIRLSPASQELALTPLVDGDIVQLGMDYRGGTEEVYRCVKMRCEFNKSWQRKVNLFNLEIHAKLKNLALDKATPIPDPVIANNFSECAICLLTLDPCQALFISPCSHAWHYKCIRPIIIKSYPQFYCPNCRSMCDLESDIEDDDD